MDGFRGQTVLEDEEEVWRREGDGDHPSRPIPSLAQNFYLLSAIRCCRIQGAPVQPVKFLQITAEALVFAQGLCDDHVESCSHRRTWSHGITSNLKFVPSQPDEQLVHPVNKLGAAINCLHVDRVRYRHLKRQFPIIRSSHDDARQLNVQKKWSDCPRTQH
eukprot:753886-Hanusia_phi.AAC.4